jgi:hypothetical protein
MKKWTIIAVAVAAAAYAAVPTKIVTDEGESVKVTDYVATHVAPVSGLASNNTDRIVTVSNEVESVKIEVEAVKTDAEKVQNKNQPNGYAGLDEDGKINAEIIETITIVFAGGEAVDIQ